MDIKHEEEEKKKYWPSLLVEKRLFEFESYAPSAVSTHPAHIATKNTVRCP